MAAPTHLPPDTAATLELIGVSCVRGTRRLFSNVDAVVQPGQLLRLQGANGAGKTSLLRTLCGLSSPDQGEVRWRGRPIADDRDAFHRELIYLGHAAALKDDLSACENLEAASVLGGQRPSASQVMSALAAAGLRQREHLSARSLSQGQRRRVSLARLVLQPSPRLWVLDEPFNALDTAATDWLLSVVTAQLRHGGIVVLTSHQPVAIDASLSQVTLTL
ncbi:MAG: cytochrome c biogenesis heme-transporting ATPase CcmA [Burkholderiaceae bacterium]|nr:cytochrome c biogenesis heme-transporting ATPase CcmA [Burkholderiaceae bacterium]